MTLNKIAEVYQDNQVEVDFKGLDLHEYVPSFEKSDLVDDLEQILATQEGAPCLTINLEHIKLRVCPQEDYDFWQALVKTILHTAEKYYQED